jgi:5-carboxymethyl-2-hydroxymuconate isomerase
MPHLVIHYTPQLDQEADLGALCRDLAKHLIELRDADDRAIFPPGGTRVLAYPAKHYAVSDGGSAGMVATGQGDYAFIYLNLRMGQGRDPTAIERAGALITERTKAHLQALMAKRYIGVTVQIDVGQEVYDHKFSNLHPLFKSAAGKPTTQ